MTKLARKKLLTRKQIKTIIKENKKATKKYDYDFSTSVADLIARGQSVR
jgi:hypothetical protein